MKTILKRAFLVLMDACALLALLIVTWLFFGPVTGFHHVIGCGLLGPMFLDGDTPKSGHLMWGGYEVHFFVVRFAISFVLWAVCVHFWNRFARVLKSPFREKQEAHAPQRGA
jgi:hypothetical protein